MSPRGIPAQNVDDHRRRSGHPRPGWHHGLRGTAWTHPNADAFAYVFDVLMLDGADLRGQPWQVRRKELERIFRRWKSGLVVRSHNLIHLCCLAVEVFSDSLEFNGRTDGSMDYCFADVPSPSRRASAGINHPAPSACCAAANWYTSSLFSPR
jgi:hypothetical protein